MRGAPAGKLYDAVTAHFKRILIYTGSFALAGLLLFLALRGVDVDELKAALLSAHYIWTIPLVLVILISHALRAWRWQMLIDALPDHHQKGDLRKVSFRAAFLSVLIGYLVNFIAPRLGEFVRAANLSRQEGFRFSGIFGTVVIERVLDMVVLVVGILSLAILFSDQFVFLQDRILAPVVATRAGHSAWWTISLVASIGIAGYLTYRIFSTSQNGRLLYIRRRLVSTTRSFKEGIMTLLHSPRRMALIGSTGLMWFFYTVMAYIPVLMLDMHLEYHLTLIDAWSLMIFGAIGIAIPSPGGTGSYHYITKLVLVNLFFVDEATALIYAVLAHGVHLIVYIVAGVLAFFIQGTSLKSLRTSAFETD